MPNTRQAAKRARRSIQQNENNKKVRTITKSAIRKAVDSITKKDLENGKAHLKNAIVAIDKAVSKGALPRNRASRKISRLTAFAKKNFPELVPAALSTKREEARKIASPSK